MDRRIYWPTDSIEWYDVNTDQWFNGFGNLLCDPDQYNPNAISFDPFKTESL